MNSDGMITMPANSGMPSQTRLTKKSNGSRLARATTRIDQVQRDQHAQRGRRAGGDDDDQEHAHLGARIDALQPAGWRASSSVKTERSIECGDAGEAVLEPADVPVRGVSAAHVTALA